MQTEIVLSLNDELLQKAQRWAELQQLSVNEAIANFIEQLPDPNKPIVLSPWTQSLVGIGTQAKNINEDELQQEYLDYLEEKYQ
ncbi:hypothetical protein RIVM261_069180 [Rivularia sp. IAM M-261]|nr:hypothetical protein RIVM261_069180 [Rivularia sp. IAM M-261]